MGGILLKEKSTSDKRKSKTRIISLEAYRKNKSEERRREYERVLFNRILGVYSFAERNGLKHVEVVDISYSGIRFREEKPETPLTVGDKLAVRFYFTPSSYLRLIVEIKRSSPYREEGREGLDYGCEIDRNTRSYDVIRQLVSFMYKYSEVACRDEHPPMIWF